MIDSRASAVPTVKDFHRTRHASFMPLGHWSSRHAHIDAAARSHLPVAVALGHRSRTSPAAHDPLRPHAPRVLLRGAGLRRSRGPAARGEHRRWRLRAPAEAAGRPRAGGRGHRPEHPAGRDDARHGRTETRALVLHAIGAPLHRVLHARRHRLRLDGRRHSGEVRLGGAARPPSPAARAERPRLHAPHGRAPRPVLGTSVVHDGCAAPARARRAQRGEDCARHCARPRTSATTASKALQ